MNTIMKSAEKHLKLCALLTFISINLNFIAGNLLKPIFLMDILRPTDHRFHHYEIHVPNLPDMLGDTITVIILVFAYLFMTSASVNRAIHFLSDKSTMHKNDSESFQYIIRWASWARDFFFTASIGFGLYFLSKYYLTIGLEVFGEEEEGSALVFGFAYLNYWVELCSAFFLVYAYCKYVHPHRVVAFLLYTFFIVRNLFLTNIMGFAHHDTSVTAAAIDILIPAVLIYSICCIIINLRKSTYQLALKRIKNHNLLSW